jgi:hypothetical protein
MKTLIANINKSLDKAAAERDKTAISMAKRDPTFFYEEVFKKFDVLTQKLNLTHQLLSEAIHTAESAETAALKAFSQISRLELLLSEKIGWDE